MTSNRPSGTYMQSAHISPGRVICWNMVDLATSMLLLSMLFLLVGLGMVGLFVWLLVRDCRSSGILCHMSSLTLAGPVKQRVGQKLCGIEQRD